MQVVDILQIAFGELLVFGSHERFLIPCYVSYISNCYCSNESLVLLSLCMCYDGMLLVHI